VNHPQIRGTARQLSSYRLFQNRATVQMIMMRGRFAANDCLMHVHSVGHTSKRTYQPDRAGYLRENIVIVLFHCHGWVGDGTISRWFSHDYHEARKYHKSITGVEEHNRIWICKGPYGPLTIINSRTSQSQSGIKNPYLVDAGGLRTNQMGRTCLWPGPFAAR